jgi:hypothetical protein
LVRVHVPLTASVSKDWVLRDQLRFSQNGRELGTHPYKYAFIVRFLTPEQQRVLRSVRGPAEPHTAPARADVATPPLAPQGAALA